MTKNLQRITIMDSQHVREKMGASLIDMQWLIGTITKRGKVDDHTIVSDPSFSIFMRYLDKYPEETILPRVPQVQEINDLLEMFWDNDFAPNKNYCTKRLGPLFGCSNLAGYKWINDSKPSQTIRHMMLLLYNAIQADGKSGLKRFMDVVKEEAASRGITPETLWDGGWTPYNKRKEEEGESGRPANNINRITSMTVQHVREKMCASLIDMHWVIGTMTRKYKVNDPTPIQDPSFSILIRYLDKYPEENPLPKVPEVYELNDLLEVFWDADYLGKNYRTKRLGPLFGCSNLAGYKWINDSIPSQTMRHMMYLLVQAIKTDGTQGLNRYIDVVEEEAESRGILTKELWDIGWKAYNRRNDELKEKEKEKERDALLTENT